MDDHEGSAVAANLGEPRPATVSGDKYTLSVDDAINRYKAAGIPRIRRTVQRYCSNGTLDAHTFAIPYGEKYLITPESLERHIVYILQGKAAMADRGEPRSDMAFDMRTARAGVTLESDDDDQRFAVSDHGGPRSEVSSDNGDIIGMLRDENRFLKEQIGVKDAQLAVKDRQIADQSERVRETNVLVASLHKLITPLLGERGRPNPLGASSNSREGDIPPPQH